MKERKAVRADIKLKGTETIEKTIGKKHSFRIYLQSKEKADEIVDFMLWSAKFVTHSEEVEW